MSADNGIYVLETNTLDGKKEYRVRHLQAVENVYWHLCSEHGFNYHFGNDGRHKECIECKFCCECDHPDCHIVQARAMWNNCKVYQTEEEAFNVAYDIETQYDYTEYGVSKISINRVFNE